MILKKIIYTILKIFLKIALLLSPNSFKLNIYYLLHYFNEVKENELFKLEELIFKKGSAIDIGCNLGLYSYALSKQRKVSKIYSFEPNKFILNHLYNYRNNKIKIFNIALSNTNKIQNLLIPYKNNFEFDGFATLEKKIFKKSI